MINEYIFEFKNETKCGAVELTIGFWFTVFL